MTGPVHPTPARFPVLDDVSYPALCYCAGHKVEINVEHEDFRSSGQKCPFQAVKKERTQGESQGCG